MYMSDGIQETTVHVCEKQLLLMELILFGLRFYGPVNKLGTIVWGQLTFSHRSYASLVL